MSQPKEKKGRTQREPGSSPSFPSNGTTAMISGPTYVSAERDMEIAHPPPVKAVVLARPSSHAHSGRVLIIRRGNETYIRTKREARDITRPEHLTETARERDRGEYGSASIR